MRLSTAPASPDSSLSSLIALGGWVVWNAPSVPRGQARRSPSPAERVAAADRDVAEDLKSPKAAEAREWLDPQHKNHDVFKVGQEKARKIIEGFYQAGAKGVFVTGIDSLGDEKITNSIVVELPRDPEARRKCFAYERESGLLKDGANPTEDQGQKFLNYTNE